MAKVYAVVPAEKAVAIALRVDKIARQTKTPDDTRTMDQRRADVVCDLVGGAGTETIWTCVAYEGRYLPVGFNDDPESGFTGRPLRKVSMGNFSVVGVLLAYMPASLPMKQFGVTPNPPERGAEVHAALCRLVADGSIRPFIGRRIGLGQVAAALEGHEQRRTSGRTVVDLSLPA